MAIATKILNFLNETRADSVHDMDEELHLDSLQFIRLSAFLQNDLDVEIADEELTIENFRTLRSIALLVTSKLQSPAHGDREQRSSPEEQFQPLPGADQLRGS